MHGAPAECQCPGAMAAGQRAYRRKTSNNWPSMDRQSSRETESASIARLTPATAGSAHAGRAIVDDFALSAWTNRDDVHCRDGAGPVSNNRLRRTLGPCERMDVGSGISCLLARDSVLFVLNSSGLCRSVDSGSHWSVALSLVHRTQGNALISRHLIQECGSELTLRPTVPSTAQQITESPGLRL